MDYHTDIITLLNTPITELYFHFSMIRHANE